MWRGSEPDPGDQVDVNRVLREALKQQRRR